MLLWQRAAEARAGMDRDESTVMGCDIDIYQTVNADADSDGPGSYRGRAQVRLPTVVDTEIGARLYGDMCTIGSWVRFARGDG